MRELRGAPPFCVGSVSCSRMTQWRETSKGATGPVPGFGRVHFVQRSVSPGCDNATTGWSAAERTDGIDETGPMDRRPARAMFGHDQRSMCQSRHGAVRSLFRSARTNSGPGHVPRGTFSPRHLSGRAPPAQRRGRSVAVPDRWRHPGKCDDCRTNSLHWQHRRVPLRHQSFNGRGALALRRLQPDRVDTGGGGWLGRYAIARRNDSRR